MSIFVMFFCGTDLEEDSREDRCGDDANRILGDGSGASGSSTTGDDKYFMEGADETSGAAEDGGDWKKVTRRRGRCKVKKARARRQGGKHTSTRQM